MNACDPVDLLFGGMVKFGPASDARTLREIEVFRRSEGSHGYVVYVLRCA